MNHHTNGVLIAPGATGACDFPGVDIHNYLVVIAGKQAEGLVIWWQVIEGGVRVYARNEGEFPHPSAGSTKLFTPMLKDSR